MTGTDQKGKEGSAFISARAPVWKKRAESSFFMIPVQGWETFFCPSDKVWERKTTASERRRGRKIWNEKKERRQYGRQA